MELFVLIEQSRACHERELATLFLDIPPHITWQCSIEQKPVNDTNSFNETAFMKPRTSMQDSMECEWSVFIYFQGQIYSCPLLACQAKKM